MPADNLKIEILTRGRLPADSKDTILLDGASGRCVHRHWSDQMGTKPKTHRFSIGADAVGTIRTAIARSSFFSWKSRVSKNVLDGDLVQVSVAIRNTRNTVLSVNATNKRLDRMVSLINKSLPATHQVSYNSLTLGKSVSNGR